MIQLNDIAAVAAAADDLNKAKAFEERKPLVAGNVLLRLREYIEFGSHPASEKSKFKKNAQKAKAVFECLTKKHLEDDGEGKMIPRTITVYFNCGTSAKSGNRKLFNAMNVASGMVYKHFVEMIGKPFKATITNTEVGEGDSKTTYSNLDQGPRDASTYTFQSLNRTDDEGEPVLDDNDQPVQVQVPELNGKPKCFLWEMAGLSDDQIVEMWEDVYIEGEWEAKEAADGKPAKAAKSKNVIQEKIMAALDWTGSRTEGLTQSFVELDELTGEEVVQDKAEEAIEQVKEKKALDLSELAAKPEKKEAEVVADIPDIPGA